MLNHRMARLNSSVNASPATPMIVSATVHVLSVCGTVMLKNSLMSQKPASFTCESMSEPAPVASTSSSACAPDVAAIGATIPAAVVIATVAEPVATRMSVAIVHARRVGDASHLGDGAADAARHEHLIESRAGANHEKNRRRRAEAIVAELENLL